MRRIMWYLVGCAVLAGCDSTNEPAAPNAGGTTEAVGVTQAAVTDLPMKSAFAIRDLGGLGGASAAAHDINQRGQIAGESDLAEPTTHAFLTDQGYRLRDLGTLGGGFSVALGVNDLGNVGGISNLHPGDDVHVHGFVWTAETGIRDMGTLGGDFSVPRGHQQPAAGGRLLGHRGGQGASIPLDPGNGHAGHSDAGRCCGRG